MVVDLCLLMLVCVCVCWPVVVFFFVFFLFVFSLGPSKPYVLVLIGGQQWSPYVPMCFRPHASFLRLGYGRGAFGRHPWDWTHCFWEDCQSAQQVSIWQGFPSYSVAAFPAVWVRYQTMLKPQTCSSSLPAWLPCNIWFRTPPSPQKKTMSKSYYLKHDK